MKSPASTQNRVREISILLVEDDQGDAVLLQNLLKRSKQLHVGITHAESIKQAESFLDTGSYDIVVLDLTLGDTKGLGTLQRLGSRILEIPIVVMSGIDDETVAIKAVQKGAQDYLIKGQADASTLERTLLYAVERFSHGRELRATQERFRLIVQSSADGIVIVDADGMVSFVNQAALDLFKKTDDELIGRTFAYPIVTTGHSEICIPQDGAADKTVEMRSVQLEWEGAPAVLILLRDISERIKLDKLKDEFVGNVSHELRTPLTIIRESISQISDGICGPTTDKQSRFLNKSLANIDRLRNIIDNLLDISKLEEGKLELYREPHDLLPIVNDIIDGFEPQFRKKGLTIKNVSKIDSLYAHIDREKIIQVLTNFVGNALKFTETGGVELLAEQVANDVVCTIRDTGKGIAQADFKSLFNKFEQVARQHGAGEKGTGLGLSISKGIIELHGGTVGVRSTENVGSSFFFTIPLQRTESESSEDLLRYITRFIQDHHEFTLVSIDLQQYLSSVFTLIEGVPARHIRQLSQLLEREVKKMDGQVLAAGVGIFILFPNKNQVGGLLMIRLVKQWIDRWPDLQRDHAPEINIKSVSYPFDGRTSLELVAKLQQERRTGLAKILVVDDEPDILELIQNRLEGEGFNVNTAGDAVEALEKMEDYRPDLVTLDILMPGVIGDEAGYGASLCDTLKSVEDYKDIPIVMISALRRDTKEEVRRMVERADAYFTKPFDSGELIAKIKGILKID